MNMATCDQIGPFLKRFSPLMLMGCLMAGCTTIGDTSNADSPVPTNAGPAMCPDGTPPPCTIRN